jgi:hypothetical protein
MNDFLSSLNEKMGLDKKVIAQSSLFSNDSALINKWLRYLNDDEIRGLVVEHKNLRLKTLFRQGMLNAIKALFNYPLSSSIKELMTEESFHELMPIAAVNGHLEVLKYVEALLTEPEKLSVIRKDNYSIIKYLARLDRPAIIKHLLTQLPETERLSVIRADNYSTIKTAVCKGQSGVVASLLMQLPEGERLQVF